MSIPLEAKEHILRLIPLGVDVYTACIHAHLTLAQIDELEEDEEFAREVDYAVKREEIRLLNHYSETVDAAAAKRLDHRAIRERLELINPERYSRAALNNRAEDKGSSESTNNVQYYIPDNGRDNIEN